jgi:hypothetical protein
LSVKLKPVLLENPANNCDIVRIPTNTLMESADPEEKILKRIPSKLFRGCPQLDIRFPPPIEVVSNHPVTLCLASRSCFKSRLTTRENEQGGAILVRKLYSMIDMFDVEGRLSLLEVLQKPILVVYGILKVICDVNSVTGDKDQILQTFPVRISHTSFSLASSGSRL